MASKQQNIATLLEGNRYNVSILPELEKYVNEQVEKGSYDLDANMALLKLYQFYPEKLQKAIVAKVLCKALMNLPRNDFLLCTCVLTPSTVGCSLQSSLNDYM
jgi:translation initiation factor 3 subunit K